MVLSIHYFKQVYPCKNGLKINREDEQHEQNQEATEAHLVAATKWIRRFCTLGILSWILRISLAFCSIIITQSIYNRVSNIVYNGQNNKHQLNPIQRISKSETLFIFKEGLIHFQVVLNLLNNMVL